MDLEKLTAPLSGDPCGPDLSFELDFDNIREMRREDDPTLQQGEWVTELKKADWPGVIQACEKLLSSKTKDLRIAGWWCDASIRMNGMSGLRNGLLLLSDLSTQYWDQVHPQIEDGDADLRIGSIAWALSQIEDLRQLAPLKKSGDVVVTLHNLQAARQLMQQPPKTDGTSEENAKDEAARQLAEKQLKLFKSISLDELNKSVDDAKQAVENLAKFQALVDEKLPDDGPSFVAARQAINDVVFDLERMSREAGGVPSSHETTASHFYQPETSTAPSSVGGNSLGTGQPLNTAPGQPMNRSQALAQLRIVADFFRRTEPHSPVAYLADKAAKWGNMPLHEWLRANLKEQGELSRLEEMLGVDPPPSSEY